MVAKVFEDNDSGYQQWLRKNPNGYVLTTGRNRSPYYMSLHRSDCHKIKQYQKGKPDGAFTERGYIKICSNSIAELLAWIKKQGGQKFTKRCSFCNPDECIADGVKDYYSQLDAEVLRSHSDKRARKTRLKSAPKLPDFFSTTTTIFRRNPDVIAEVLARAKGKCELCHQLAPFKRASDGSPYLEVHHQVQLSLGGEDTVENAIAVCPNCHRKEHFG